MTMQIRCSDIEDRGGTEMKRKRVDLQEATREGVRTVQVSTAKGQVEVLRTMGVEMVGEV